MDSIDDRFEDSQIENPGRREFLRTGGLAAAGIAAGINPFADSEVEAQGSRDRALLYDISLSSFGAQRDKKSDKRRLDTERQRILDKLDSKWEKFLKVASSRVRHRFYLDVNTIAQHADRIVADVRQKGITGAYKQQQAVYFNPNLTSGVYANVLIDRDIGTTVREISTAYTPQDVQATTTALITGTYKGKLPKAGDLAQFPIRFLKFASRAGMKEGTDYHAYKLQPGQTFHNLISTYTQGDYSKNVDAVLKFNSIKRTEMNSLSAGTSIYVPREIYRNPLQPIVAEEKVPGKYVTVPAPRLIVPAETPEESAERVEREKEKRDKIPELGASVNSYLDDVIAQNLMVLGQSEMPSVLTEAFNMRNEKQITFYSNDRNLNRLAEAYGKGIISYLQANPHVTKVITDNGHGEGDPGAPNRDKNPTLYEGHFTQKIWTHLSEFLRSEQQRLGMKFEVFPLDYKGGGRQRERLNWYVEQANRINKTVNGKDDSIYVSIHINSARGDFEPPPEVRVHGKGPQPKSTELGAHILAQAVPFYQNSFK